MKEDIRQGITKNYSTSHFNNHLGLAPDVLAILFGGAEQPYPA